MTAYTGLTLAKCEVDGNTIDVGLGAPIKVLSEKDPSKLPWKELGIDIVMECTGIFTDKAKAEVHLTAGAKRVLVSAPSKGADLTVVYGVNHEKLTPEHKVVSNASCTTNCLAPVAKVLNDLVGIKSGFMTTIHAYTNDQRILDQAHKDMRRARAAALSMIPTSTGAASAVGLVLPELKGRLDGTSIRVPTPNVSAIDLKFVPGRETTVEEINLAMEHASRQQLKGILELRHGGACLHRLQSLGLFDEFRFNANADRRWPARPRSRLVRQRVGLLQPHARHRRRHGQAALSGASRSAKTKPSRVSITPARTSIACANIGPAETHV